MLATILSRYWWTLALRGVLWIVFGILALVMPAVSLLTLTLMFGVFVLMDGIACVVSAIGGRRESSSWVLLLLAGLAGILTGVLTFVSPRITALILLYYVAAWCLVTGVVQIVAAIRLRKEIDNELWLGLAGFASLAFGVLIVANPGAGILAVLWILAIYAIALGVILIMLGLRSRSLATA
jgi:uncharacterized membrane protein HdeD (DUF308 family)